MSINTLPTLMFALLVAFSFNQAIAQNYNSDKAGFDIVALGTQGGVNTHDLSAFLIGPRNQPVSVACDAGSLTTGITAAIKAGSFSDALLPPDYQYNLLGYILKEHIKGYLISHAHLDHVAGLITASVDDSNKPIYGLPSTIDTLKTGYFNWQVWPNFASNGPTPSLGKYQYIELKPYEAQAILNTPMSVVAFELSHDRLESTAFVVEYLGDIVVCLGDTGLTQ